MTPADSGAGLSRRALLQATAVVATAAATVNLTATPAQGATVPAFADATTFGAKADGMTDNAPAIRAAWNSGAKKVLLPPGVMILGSQLVVPAGVKLVGAGKYATILSKGFSGDAVVLGTEAGLEDLRLEGNGSTRTGANLVIPDNTGRQHVRDVVLGNSQGPSLLFAGINAGAQSRFSGLDVRRVGANVGTEIYNIVIPATQQLAAVPRHFWGLETNGQPAFDFGGCNGTFITSSVLGRLKYTAETRNVRLGECRLLNEDHFTFAGHANGIVNCDIRPRITVKAGSSHCRIEANAHNLDNPVTKEVGVHESNTVSYNGRFW